MASLIPATRKAGLRYVSLWRRPDQTEIVQGITEQAYQALAAKGAGAPQGVDLPPDAVWVKAYALGCWEGSADGRMPLGHYHVTRHNKIWIGLGEFGSLTLKGTVAEVMALRNFTVTSKEASYRVHNGTIVRTT